MEEALRKKMEKRAARAKKKAQEGGDNANQPGAAECAEPLNVAGGADACPSEQPSEPASAIAVEAHATVELSTPERHRPKRQRRLLMTERPSRRLTPTIVRCSSTRTHRSMKLCLVSLFPTWGKRRELTGLRGAWPQRLKTNLLAWVLRAQQQMCRRPSS